MGRSDGREVPLYEPKDIYIQLHWQDRGKSIKTFNNVHDLAQFLKDNPLLAKAVGYIARTPKMISLQMPQHFMSISPGDQKIWIWRAKEILGKKGEVLMDGKTFTDEAQFEKYLNTQINRR